MYEDPLKLLVDISVGMADDEPELAHQLRGLVYEIQEQYVKLETDGDVPTIAQGVALARFLRPHFNSDKNHWGAFISRGGAGLGNDYIHVRFNDGYCGGIDKTGRTST